MGDDQEQEQEQEQSSSMHQVNRVETESEPVKPTPARRVARSKVKAVRRGPIAAATATTTIAATPPNDLDKRKYEYLRNHIQIKRAKLDDEILRLERERDQLTDSVTGVVDRALVSECIVSNTNTTPQFVVKNWFTWASSFSQLGGHGHRISCELLDDSFADDPEFVEKCQNIPANCRIQVNEYERVRPNAVEKLSMEATGFQLTIEDQPTSE